MLRNEPWEPATTLHEMNRQLITLNDENKQQWYDRPHQNAGVPPLWLGFYDPAAPPEECVGCAEACLDLYIPEIILAPGKVINADAARIEVGPICAGTLYVNEALANNPGWRLEIGGGLGCCSWYIVFRRVVSGVAQNLSFHITSETSPCVGEWNWSVSSENSAPTINGTLTTSAADCGDPPPTPTGTSSGTASATSSPDCGTAQSYEWSEGPFPTRGWYPLTYTCTCSGYPPARDGAYQGEVADGICE